MQALLFSSACASLLLLFGYFRRGAEPASGRPAAGGMIDIEETNNHGRIHQSVARAELGPDPVGRDGVRGPGPNFATLFRFLREARQPNKEPMSAIHPEPIATDIANSDRTAAFTARAVTRRVGVAPPPDREQAFAKAGLRSARVRRLRRVILIGGLGTVAAMFLTAVFNPFATKLASVGLSKLSVEGTKIVMEHPKLAGFRNDGQAYLMTAKRALQDIKQPTVMELEQVEGEIGAANGESTHVTANSGVYDSLGEHMELSDNVRITNGRANVLMRSAKFDFKSGAFRSDEPVEVRVSDGTTIVSDRAFAINHGQELTFDGHVKTRIVPQTDQQPAADAKGNNP
jgi:lipopolysaccharide export system protein LptC